MCVHFCPWWEEFSQRKIYKMGGMREETREHWEGERDTERLGLQRGGGVNLDTRRCQESWEADGATWRVGVGR